jgi:hypothetical protein
MQVTAGSIFMPGKIIGIKAPECFVFFSAINKCNKKLSNNCVESF